MKKWEIHFCEGTYFMAKEVGVPCGIIDNTFTEFIGEFSADTHEINNILKMLEKAYQLQKDFPLEEEINKPVETTKEQPRLTLNAEEFDIVQEAMSEYLKHSGLQSKYVKKYRKMFSLG